MTRILLLAGLVILGTALVCGACLAYTFFSPVVFAAITPAPIEHETAPEKIELYDVDAMAARMPADRDFYAKVRDQALAAYSAQHPGELRVDPEVKASIQLAAYYLTWGDPYGERVLLDLADIEADADHHGCDNRMLCNLQTDGWDENHYPDKESRAVELDNEILSEQFDKAPDAFKLWGAQTAIITTVEYNADANTIGKNPPSMQLIPKLLEMWKGAFIGLIKDKAPDHVLYGMPDALLDGCKGDQATMDFVIAAIGQAFNEAGSDNSIRVALDGDYCVTAAWAARGGGYADTVSNSQFQSFGERLDDAQRLLETAFDKYPNEVHIPVLMIKVAMGKSLDRNTMETWFQRAIKINPNYYGAYLAKEWYLQPRWLGNVEDEWAFDQECVATQDWPHAVPMVMAEGL